MVHGEIEKITEVGTKKMGVHFPSFLSFTNYFFHFSNPALHPLISLNWRHRVRIGYTGSVTLENNFLLSPLAEPVDTAIKLSASKKP